MPTWCRGHSAPAQELQHRYTRFGGCGAVEALHCSSPHPHSLLTNVRFAERQANPLKRLLSPARNASLRHGGGSVARPARAPARRPHLHRHQARRYVAFSTDIPPRPRVAAAQGFSSVESSHPYPRGLNTLFVPSQSPPRFRIYAPILHPPPRVLTLRSPILLRFNSRLQRVRHRQWPLLPRAAPAVLPRLGEGGDAHVTLAA